MISRQRQLVNRKSPIANPDGFTLIELLVVISIVALLMAVLLPTFQGVRNQAKAVGCQANLRQWGLYYSMYTADSEGRLPQPYDGFGWYAYTPAVLPREFPGSPPIRKSSSGQELFAYYCTSREGRKLLLCPATRFQPLQSGPYVRPCQNGTTRLAWSYPAGWTIPEILGSSYGKSVWVPPTRGHYVDGTLPEFWTSCLVKGASAMPVYCDSRTGDSIPRTLDEPPLYEDAPVDTVCGLPRYAMNRHDGGINMLFMDWSVRKVGVKELWTLRWNKQFDPAGPWTKQGGVQPEDWPQWMRRFPDY